MMIRDTVEIKKKHIPEEPKRIKPVRYCGREFTIEEMKVIREIVKTKGLCRTAISEKICEELLWLKADGKLKDMSCRVALLRMERDGWFKLPPSLRRNGSSKEYKHSNMLSDKYPLLNLPAGKIADINIDIVKTRKQSQIWNETIHRGKRQIGRPF